MLTYVIRRLLRMIPTLIAISVMVFVIIQLPPGDFFDSLQAQLAESDSQADQEAFDALRRQYHLDKPMWQQYLYWVSGCLRGDFGYSFEWRRPVSELIAERLGLTFLMALGALLFMWLVALPIGVYSARNRYSFGDYFWTFVAFIGLCVPGFIIALVAMYMSVFWFGGSAGGLFSPDFKYAAWSLAKVWDLSMHLWVPVVVIGAAGTASLMRIMRTSMLDVLDEQYITTARAKGLAERWVIYKYAVRQYFGVANARTGVGVHYCGNCFGAAYDWAAVLSGIGDAGYVFGRYVFDAVSYFAAFGQFDGRYFVGMGGSSDQIRIISYMARLWEGLFLDG